VSHSISWTYNNKHLIPSSHHHLHLLNLPLLLFTIICCTYLLHIGKPVSNLAITSMAVATPTIELKEMTNLKTELMNISKQKGRFVVSLLYAYPYYESHEEHAYICAVECRCVTSYDCCDTDHYGMMIVLMMMIVMMMNNRNFNCILLSIFIIIITNIIIIIIIVIMIII